jgi:hypothetical protein
MAPSGRVGLKAAAWALDVLDANEFPVVSVAKMRAGPPHRLKSMSPGHGAGCRLRTKFREIVQAGPQNAHDPLHAGAVLSILLPSFRYA